MHFDHGSIPRSEVVASVNSALAGGNNFEVQFNITIGANQVVKVEDLTRNGMEVTGDLSGDFSIYNTFVMDKPDAFYTVECLIASEDCHVTQSGLNEHGLVNCVEEESSLSSGDIPAACLAKHYDLALKTFEEGPHFFLHVTSHDADAAGQDGCPSNVAFYSKDGMKKKAALFEDDFKDIPGRKLGSVTLGEILFKG